MNTSSGLARQQLVSCCWKKGLIHCGVTQRPSTLSSSTQQNSRLAVARAARAARESTAMITISSSLDRREQLHLCWCSCSSCCCGLLLLLVMVTFGFWFAGGCANRNCETSITSLLPGLTGLGQLGLHNRLASSVALHVRSRACLTQFPCKSAARMLQHMRPSHIHVHSQGIATLRLLM